MGISTRGAQSGDTLADLPFAMEILFEFDPLAFLVLFYKLFEERFEFFLIH